ncbi:winged helix-turn-helix transcriptional regulator [Cellulosimicrobium cellulans]|uniref:MarR family winged helix-turn-helix transcriptional regulator n=1 Tax=Cellulosimicrobium cellulans TaxID=1710 RepID=UPI001966B66A|nr:MarR family winged helix-turn-helix transcriptional regulator [Cellulosimicrobium cellulans]MBN0041808.1 winged helix-turn-helix transcriptional regulator [Cellulosimicrobium cellulans]
MSTTTTTAAATAPAELPGRLEDLGWHLGVLLRAYRATVEQALDDVPHGARGYQVLVTVAQGDHPTQLALAEHHGIDRTVMTYLVDDLVAAGLVERRQNPADRRARRVVATSEGRRRLAAWATAVHDAEEELLGMLSPGERSIFRTLMRRVACDLRDVDATTDPCTVAEHTLAGTTPPNENRTRTR